MYVIMSSYLKPRKIIWSQNQVSISISTMLGKAKPNQLAKLITPPLLGKSLQERQERRRDEITKGRMNIWNNTPLGLFVPYWSIWPLRMRLGVVPVSVAVPPMLAE